MSFVNHSAHRPLEIFFIPFVAPGHMIPMIDLARAFATRQGVRVHIIITTHNALLFKSSIDQDVNSSNADIQLHILKFPSSQVGLPEGIENFNSITSPDMYSKVYQGISILQQPMEKLLHQNNPDCIISDMYYPWTNDLANQLGCPRLVFRVNSFFSLSVMESIRRYRPHDTVSSDSETFQVPGLPYHHCIEMIRSQLPDYVRTRTPYGDLMDTFIESEMRSYGVIVNSFYELESPYADHFRNVMGMKAWQVGPVSLCIKREVKDADDEQKKQHKCMSWLDSMEPNSVVYVSFGSMARFQKTQLIEIASALETCGYPFIWVVREPKEEGKNQGWLLGEFERRMNKKGIIIRDWAPQVTILAHPAIGGFVTHCGWNSVLESVAEGVPMITWPLFAEQFYNEKLVIEVLKIGVRVGVYEWEHLMEEGKIIVGRKKIEKAVKMLMDGGDEADEMKKRARQMSEKAKRAGEEGGSSCTNLIDLVEELKVVRHISI
ncbi:hypothetical protein C5167_013794 [Papaver somniferum]|uniref:Glycosyltransferase n=1 Tax=Papaver somniferum TaxID=3469 RepID=A0A4Y7J4H2_PAPSO|nr:scopoletin glucosyltransferase-like [Papaver somniferum]RZC54952.1 hypothetical protein C5167_013794 [Papaver somniferum]